MRNRFSKPFYFSLLTITILSLLTTRQAFSGFPPRSYDGPGIGAATFYITPQDSNFTSTKPTDNRTGEWFSIQVRIANHSNVSSWQIQLIWKTGLLDIPYPLYNVTKGSPYIFTGIPSTGLSLSLDPFNGTHRRLLASESTYLAAEAPAAADSGLLIIWFQIKSDPDPAQTLSTLLYFEEKAPVGHKTWTLDGSLEENDCTMLDGYYENKYFLLVHDVAMTNVMSSKTVVGQGESMNISVTVENQGDYTEDVNVTAYANASIAQRGNITLTKGSSATITLTWNTSGFVKGNYNISAYAEVLDDTDPADNSRADGTVLVSLDGDVNGDKDVDGKDIALIAKYFGKPASYYPNADINNDGEIDGKDLSIAAKNFGKSWI